MPVCLEWFVKVRILQNFGFINFPMPKLVLKDKMSKLNSLYVGNQFECYQGVYLVVVSDDVIFSSKGL